MYFDPGFGSMVIQIIVASVAGIGAYLLAFKSKFSGMFNKNKSTNVADQLEDVIDDDDDEK